MAELSSGFLLLLILYTSLRVSFHKCAVERVLLSHGCDDFEVPEANQKFETHQLRAAKVDLQS